MSLTPGTRLGVYEITALVGEGGLGQVYRATDTKLKRQVAITILPAQVERRPGPTTVHLSQRRIDAARDLRESAFGSVVSSAPCASS